MLDKKQEIKALVQQNELSTEPISMEDKLLSAHLVSAINKQQGHISISLTDKGLLCLINAFMLQKQEAEKTAAAAPSPTPSQPQTKLLSKKEVMQILGVCDTTLYLWGKSGYLSFEKIGTKVKYHPEDVYAILNRRKKGGVE